MEKEILWFCFRRAEPERMISGWTASSRDSSKTEEGKAPRGYGQIPARTPNEFEAQVVLDFALVGLKSARRALSPLCLRAIISRANVLPDIILSFSAGRCRQYLLLPEGFRRNERPAGCIGPSASLRPLIVSRVKCGGDLVAATQHFRVREIG